MINFNKIKKLNETLKQRKRLMLNTLVVPVNKSANKEYIKLLTELTL